MMLDNMDGLFLVQEEKGQYRLSSKSEETGDISEIRVEFKDKRYPSRLTVDFHSGNIVVYQLLEYRETGAGEGLFSLGSYQRLYHLDMK